MNQEVDAPQIETIAAPATPAGESALAVIRISGPQALRIAAEALGIENPEPRSATVTPYRDIGGSLVDSAVSTYFQRPRSFTGEDLLEISTHGNPLIVRKILDDLVARGCRMAEPGEFTRRALMNGKLDLTQAEAIADVIHARSNAALVAAQEQLDGSLSREVESSGSVLMDLIAEVEAYIDFPEEDLPPEENRSPILPRIKELRERLIRLCETQERRRIVHDGYRVALIGAPNVGKSSLLNRIAGENRALVAETPGTTRDYIEVSLHLGGYLVKIVDTAGLRENAGVLETQGIEHTRKVAENADLVLHIVQPERELATENDGFCSENRVVVLNKADLLKDSAQDAIEAEIKVSALSGEGFKELESLIIKRCKSVATAKQVEGVLVSARHAASISRALEELDLPVFDGRNADEIVAQHLRAALHELEAILGKIDNERILDRIFAEFCIGK